MVATASKTGPQPSTSEELAAGSNYKPILGHKIKKTSTMIVATSNSKRQPLMHIRNSNFKQAT